MTMIEENNGNSSLSSSSQQQQSQNPYPCTIFYCRPNSHPFQERRIPLTEPVKVGRAVARLKALQNNAIFDCKVLSRQHAKLWYENGKFYLQDTKSSNGTFVNNQRLGKCNEESLPFEIFSGDIVQFGVDVTENNRKTTHNCIIIEAKLYNSDGSEALPRSSSHPLTQLKDLDVNTRSLYELAQYLQEALQREQQLEQKLTYLQNVLQDTQKASNDGWQAIIDEDRLLARINALEDQIRAYHVKHPNEDTVKQEIVQLTQTRMKYEEESKIKLERALLEKTDAVSRVRNLECTVQLAQDELKRIEEQNEQQKQEIHHLVNQIDEQRALLIDFEQKLKESQTRCAELDYERNRIEADFQEYFLRTQKLEELQQQQQKIMNNNNNNIDNEQNGLNIIETRGRFRVHSSSKDEYQKQQTDTPMDNNIDYDKNDDDSVIVKQNDEEEKFNENGNNNSSSIIKVDTLINENGNEDEDESADGDEQENDLDNVIQNWYNFENEEQTSVIDKQQSFLSQPENKSLFTGKEDKHQSLNNHEDTSEQNEHKGTNTNEIKFIHSAPSASIPSISSSSTTISSDDETKSLENTNDELNVRLALKERECAQYKYLLENEEKASALIRQQLNETKERLNSMEEQYRSEHNRWEVVTRESSMLRIQFQLLKEQYDQLLKQKPEDNRLNITTEPLLVTKQKELNDLNETILTKQNEFDKLNSDIEHLKVIWCSLSDDLKLSTQSAIQLSSVLPNGAYPPSLPSLKTSSPPHINTNGFSSLSSKISTSSESETNENQMNDFVQLRDECAQLKNRIVRIENDMKCSRQENLQLSSEYNRLQDTYEELQTLKNALESSEMKIKHNLTDAQKEVDQYHDKLEEARNYIQKLENHCAELQKVLEETVNEYDELLIRTKTVSVCSIIPVGILVVAFVAAFYPILSKITATY
ncbi:unnamed protein product [Didymodactylos carnosus]|nr:unnamed protein product [Didymodactylos carnosus]CAF3807698.1 unnamed protein product [Didymodactylos carnosus]